MAQAGTLRVGFLMDPLESVVVGHDSTFALMLECARRGHAVEYLTQPDLSFRDGRTCARLRRVQVRREPGNAHTVLEDRCEPLEGLDALLLRKDPPVDAAFIEATHLVDLAGPHRPFLVNEPSGLRDANEKLFALRFPDLSPPTFVGASRDRLLAFVEQVGAAVLKPLEGCGGQGVVQVGRGDRNLRALADLYTGCGRRPVLAQAYLPEVRQGDKRILLLDGEPVGAVLRVPREDDHRANLAAGGTPVRTAITAGDRAICDRLAPELRRMGLHFVGIDVIGGRLTEVNVTSPTGIEEIDALEGVRLEAQVIDFLERRAATR